MCEMENINEELCNLRVACIGKTADIWKRQSYAKDLKMVDGNPLDPSSWKGVDVGFLLVDADMEEYINNLTKAVYVSEATCILLLIPIVISLEPVEVSIPLLTINPENYKDEYDVYKTIYYAIKSINDVVALPGLINLDIADVIAICQNKTNFIFVIGRGKR